MSLSAILNVDNIESFHFWIQEFFDDFVACFIVSNSMEVETFEFAGVKYPPQRGNEVL